MEEKIKAIYYIKDLRNDKIIYIGQTTNFIGRKHEHFRKNDRPIDLYMYEEGRQNFSIEIFDIDCTNMSDDERKNKEDELILQYDTINNGLNKKRSGLITKTEDYSALKIKRYRENNKEHCKEYNKEYRKTEKYKEYYKEYRKTEKRKQYEKEYYHSDEYREKSREKSRQYRARKKQQKSDAQTTL